MKKSFGLRFDGLEEPLEQILKENIKGKDEYVFAEIGTAAMKTHRAILDIIKENIGHEQYFTIAVDLIGSLDVSFDQINKIFKEDEIIVSNKENIMSGQEKIGTGKYHTLLVLKDNPREYIISLPDESLDCCLIDACHGKACVLNDFIAVKAKLKSGGLCLFHDSGTEETGTDWQSHCSTNIDVRGALLELGLFDDKFEGWKFITELQGTRKTQGNPDGGNSLAIFQKL